MDETLFGLRVTVALGYDQALERTTAALKTEGFGVLTTIDVKQTLKQKIDAEFRRYAILGACNPALAHRALQAEIEIGLLLPCNLIVYETGPGQTVVAAMAPLPTIGIVGDNPTLVGVAHEADERLRRVLASLEAIGAQAPAGEEETMTTHRTDAEIFTDARSALDHQPSVPQDVRVHVDAGVVTLTGSVRWASERADAEDTVRGVKGIARIVNDITVAQVVSAEGLEAPERVH